VNKTEGHKIVPMKQS